MLMSRLPPITPGDMTSAQREVFEAITTGKRGAGKDVASFLTPEGGMRGPFGPWLYAPAAGGVAQRLGEVLRFEGLLTDRQREIGILCVAAYWGAEYEWHAHTAIARGYGVEESVIAGIERREDAELADPSEAAVHDVARSLLDDKGIPDDLYERARDALGEARLAELVILVGYYGLVAVTLNAFDVRARSE